MHISSLVAWPADAAAAISAETATLLRDVNQDNVDADPFASHEEFEVL